MGGILSRVGFTLIELLAVIVILAIIALISTPIIIGVIEKAKRGAFEDSAYGIIEAGKNYYVTSLNENNAFTGEYFDFQYKKDVDALKVGGSVPKEGYLILNDKGESRISIGDSEKTWACKDYNEEKIRMQDSKCVFKVSEVVEKYFLKITEGKINGTNTQIFNYTVESDLDSETADKNVYEKDVTVEVPENKEGKVFSYWKCNGNTRGYTAKLTLHLYARNYFCEPVYETTKRTKEPFSIIEDYYISKKADGKFRIMNYWQLNDTRYQKQAVGMIATRSKSFNTEDMMVIENKDKYDDLVGIETINPTNSSWVCTSLGKILLEL